MCSSLYLELNKLFPETEATMLGDYFSTLTGNATASITVSKASQAMKTSSQDTYELLYRCVQGGILSMEYAARCPECDMLICRFHSSDEFPDDEFECYNCHEVITLSRDNIEVVFSLNKPFFPQGPSTVAQPA